MLDQETAELTTSGGGWLGVRTAPDRVTGLRGCEVRGCPWLLRDPFTRMCPEHQSEAGASVRELISEADTQFVMAT